MAVNTASPILAQILSSEYWFGAENAFSSLLISLIKGGDLPSMEEMRSLDGGEHDMNQCGGKYHYMTTRYDDVAVIDIRGPLVCYESPYNRYYGIVSYEEIRNAVATVSRDPEISKILLKIDSPGGTAKLVDECCEFLRTINTSVMPIYALASGEMCSAAYFLGSAASRIFITQLSVAGSIGAIRPLVSYFRMYQEAGLDTVILRSPEFKALGHPLDPLNEKSTAILQEATNKFALLFEQSVARNRGTSLEIVQSKYGRGLTFIGQDAVTNGLADEVATFDSVIRRLRSTNNGNFI